MKPDDIAKLRAEGVAMRITLTGKILAPWAEDDLLRSCSWLSGCRMKYFLLFGLRIGMGLVWIECLSCKHKRPSPKPFCYGTSYFQIGYFAITAARLTKRGERRSGR